MKNDYKDNKFQKLLNKLQQESWQLELLISGFAIFGLISSLAPIKRMGQEAAAVESYTKAFFIIAGSACMVLIVNLVIHVVLRGLWIGAIGYVTFLEKLIMMHLTIENVLQIILKTRLVLLINILVP